MAVKVLVTGALHPNTVEAFTNHSKLAVTYKPDCPRTELLDSIADYQVLVTRSETAVDKVVLERAKQLKVVARAAVGVGNIDIADATERGILVINCPGKNTNSAAELTMGLLIAMLRNIPSSYAHLKSGGWDRHRFAGRELRAKKIGLVGLGNVGHRVAKFAHGFDMEVFAYDPYVSPAVFERNRVHSLASLKELAEQVDILSFHVPLNRETTGMLNAQLLNALPEGAYVVNAARGPIANEEDVLEALNSGHIAGYAVDTFHNEPTPRRDLIEHAKVWCTPHIGASTVEAQEAIGETVYDQVLKALDGGVVDFPVNLPEVGIPDSPLLKSYSVLAQKLGSMLGQVIDFNPREFELHYRGELAGLDVSLVRLALMKGYASHVVDDYVSFVNTAAHFRNLGIKIKEQQDPAFETYKSALKIVVTGSGDRRMTIGGTVFDGQYPRITLLNGFHFEMDPVGSLIIMENLDRPGVIGAVGQFLASYKVNIDNFALSRNKPGGKAIAVIRVDDPTPEKLVAGLSQIEHVVMVKSATL